MKPSQFKEGYGREFIEARQAQERELDEQQAWQKSDNERAREAYLRKLGAQRKAEREAFEDLVDERLAPQREQHRRQWLVDHPGQDSRDFDKVWRHLRKTLKEDLLSADLAATREQLMNSGIYADGL